MAAFGFVCGANSWVEMFLSSGVDENLNRTLTLLRLILQPLTGLILLKFGWGIFKQMAPLPAWMSFVSGILIVPLAYAITYAATTFVTPSPIEIPVDIWSRYLLYLPEVLSPGPASYYNYDRVVYNAFIGEQALHLCPRHGDQISETHLRSYAGPD